MAQTDMHETRLDVRLSGVVPTRRARLRTPRAAMAHGWRRLARNTPHLEVLSLLRNSQTTTANGQTHQKERPAMTFELTACLARHGLKLHEVFPLLQGNNVISDNSSELEDIGRVDSAAAVKWLDNHPFQIEEMIQIRPEREEILKKILGLTPL